MSEMMQAPDGWEVLKLSDIGNIITGNTPSTDVEEYYNGNIPFIGPVDFDAQKYILETEKTVSDEGLKCSREIPKDAIMTVCIGSTIGKIALSTKTSCTNQQVNSLVCGEKYVSEFVYYSMAQFLQKQLDVEAGLQAVPIVNKSSFSNLTLLAPKEKKEQEKIAKILSTLDKAIESTNRLIEKEKHIKTALMQELLTNGIDQNGQIRSPQTHTYKPSELGLIPDGWEVVRANKIAKVGSSKRIFEHEYVSDGIPFYRSTEIILKAQNKSVKSEIHISKDKFEEIKSSYNVPQKDDILISAVGTIGVPYLVKNEQFYFKDGNLLWIQNIKINPNYLYLFVKSERFQNEINLIAGGSSQSALTIEKLSLLKIIYPKSIDEQKQIAKILTTQDKKTETEETNLAKLKELKKGLMNDLLSGEVRVKV